MIDKSRFLEIMRKAGAMALASWPGHGRALDVWEKHPGSPVSAADMAVDAFLKAELHALLPAAGWLSEETTDAPENRRGQLIWLVDPIDGTRDFIHGRRGWAVSVALISGGRPLLGALFAPARGGEAGEMWFAEVGHGATRNGEALAASACRRFTGARMPAAYLAEEDVALQAIEAPNSIALRMAMVAAGEADVLATLRWGYEWDLGAAALIAAEAGASVSDALGQKIVYNKPDPRAFGLLVCAPGLREAALRHFAERARRLSK